ncbi:MAG: hypothetical protein GX452_06650 [Ignavibacteriales bacterium]|jgi:Zn-finger nucleic acid-binding protein|nr:zf-TFIIB domain-containing protein [Ignavibacteriaceae bacterium]NLH61067.1 hypothetical protein [Ignavibacteriales bacterium]HOJ17731.1 zf-TFIIB domain-containing protein [Ignavibacteriaceae bacterium]HPO55641.1 zf-TFIIB domain-containing protein [Ignavibacteriaceae bacterium]
MNCPVCKTTKLVISDRQGIEIDYCPDCRGVWLDRGELDKIIEKSIGQLQSSFSKEADRNYDRKDDYFKYDYKKRKKGSFLGELFDF